MAEDTSPLLSAGGEPLSDQSFDGDTAEDALIENRQFRNCHFSGCNFDFATIQSCQFINCRFDSCSFKETVFEDCHFCEEETGSIWRYSNLSRSAFRRTNISLCHFIGCEACEMTLEECSAQGAKFDLDVHRKIASKVIHGGLRAEKCKFQYAEFSSADLSESRLEGCDLRDANFSGCNLTQASLRGSSIHNTDFQQTILDGANLAHASFDDIDFAGMASHHGVVVSRDQHENILTSMGIITLD